jgi:hypothetical protein
MHQLQRSFDSGECSPVVEDFAAALAGVVEYIEHRGLGAESQDTRSLLRRLLEIGARESPNGGIVSRAARMMYSNRRTIGRQCQRAGLPPPSAILGFGRVVRTAWLMQSRGWTATRAASAAGWPDAFGFSNAMLRLIGKRPSEIPRQGLLQLAESWLMNEISAGRAELRSPRPPLCPSCGNEISVRSIRLRVSTET